METDAALSGAGIDVFAPGTPSDHTHGTAPVVVLAPEGHHLVAGAAERIAAAFRAEPAMQALYGDALLERVRAGPLLPVLRPAFDEDYLRGVDYVGPVVAFRRSVLDALGSVPMPCAEAFDLLLQIADRFGREAIWHCPQVLSLWRPSACADSSGCAARQVRLAAVRRSLARSGAATATAQVFADGVIRIARRLPEPAPLVSLIVPTRDRLDLLGPCLRSLQRTNWPNKEILICDNESRDPATLGFFKEITARREARVLSCPGPFDFAGMNNGAAAEVRGSVLAFVNNDVEALQPDWLDRMVREALRPEIGAVGAKLIDGEGRIQHGGIVLGTGGLVTHGHRHFPGDAPGYLSALLATHAVSAVTAACLVVETSKFRSVGGFDAQNFSVDFNDVDLCLRLNAAGFRTLLVPDAVLVHREAASRRWNPAARARHEGEIAALRKRWGPLLAQDPHYHPGFDPGLSTHARLQAGWIGSGLAPLR